MAIWQIITEKYGTSRPPFVTQKRVFEHVEDRFVELGLGKPSRSHFKRVWRDLYGTGRTGQNGS
jgi:hypothetical protein